MLDDWIENARMIVDSARAIVPAEGNLARVRACRDTSPGFDRTVFATMADMGWLHLRLPEAQGGLGLGMREYCALLEVLGQGLVPEPIIGSALAFRLMSGNIPDAAARGEKILLAAWQDRPNTLAWDTGASLADGCLDGKKYHIPGAMGAEMFAIVTAGGVALVEADADGVSIGAARTQDGGETGHLTLTGVAAELIPVEDMAQALDEAILAQAAYLLGLSERAFEITLDYLRVREQFDRPIGSFQALQHRATDIKIQLELARAGTAAAAAAIDEGMDGVRRASAVSRAKARSCDLAALVSREAIQMHGAIGYTDEADIGLFVRKAMTQANLFGSARVHRARYATLLPEFEFS